MDLTMARQRKQYAGEEKLAILRKHLLEGVAVSDICDEHDLQPMVFSGGRSSSSRKGRWDSTGRTTHEASYGF